MKTETTPKLTLVNDEGAFAELYIEDDSGWGKQSVAVCRASNDDERQRARTNARRIVTTWNSHDDLVATLKSIRDSLDPDKEGSHRSDDPEGAMDTAFDRAAKAITLAESEAP